MADTENQEKPKTLAEAYPDFEEKYKTLNNVYVGLWEAKRSGDNLSALQAQAKEALDWARRVIETFIPVTEFEQKVQSDTATFSLGNRLGKDELLLKQLFISMQQLSNLLGR